DPKQQTTTWSYDALNRATQQTFVGGQHSVSYDPAGMVKSVSDGTISVAYDFDLLDRLTSYSVPVLNRTISLQYDQSDLLKQFAVNGGSPQTYTRDANGRVTQVRAPFGVGASFGY